MSQQTAVEALRLSVEEPVAFARFYDQHAEGVLAYLMRRTYDPDVAMDLTAETFAQAYIARFRFRGSTDRAAAAWLYKIARRQLARYFRKSKAERKALKALGIQKPQLDEEQYARIDELAERADLRDVLRIELERLSHAHREALQLRVVQELPYSEVARRLNISEQAARARVSRALRRLADALDRNPLVKEVHT